MLRFYRIEVLLVLITISVVLLMVFFNDINIHIRIKELKIFLQKKNIEDNNLDHISLIMKYRHHKRIYENTISQDKADLIEMRVNGILAEETYNIISIQRYKYLAIPALFTINFFRFLIGKNSIKDIEDDKSNIFLDLAYYYERNKCYNKALEIYNKALNNEKFNRAKIAGIILHQGFCHSVIGNYKEAKKKFLTLIEDYGDENIAMTAAILLRYLEGFKSEVEKILKYEKDSIVKGEKLYKLIAYRESIKVLKSIEKDIGPSERSRIQFFKGRCHEELGEKDKAMNSYQNLIINDHRSSYAKLANRRIYVIGSLAYNGSQIKKLAIKNNQLLKDHTFTKIVDETSLLNKGNNLENKLKNNPLFRKTFETLEKDYLIHNDEELITYNKYSKKIDEIIKEKKTYKKKTEESYKLHNVKIYTDDGNIFVGQITTETDEYINLKTMIGDVIIDKNKVTNRTE